MPSLVETWASRSKLSRQLAFHALHGQLWRDRLFPPPMYWTYTPGHQRPRLKLYCIWRSQFWPTHGCSRSQPATPHPGSITSDLARLQTMGRPTETSPEPLMFACDGSLLNLRRWTWVYSHQLAINHLNNRMKISSANRANGDILVNGPVSSFFNFFLVRRSMTKVSYTRNAYVDPTSF